MTILQKGFEAQAQAMREFGYPDVTADMIATAHAAWKRGEKASGVIAMFAEKEFNDRPEIFGERDAA